MIKAFLLIFRPVKAWEQVLQAQHSTGFILTMFLLPLLLVTSAVEGYGLVKWGERQLAVKLAVDYVKPFSVGEVLVYEGAQLVLSVLIVFLGASTIKSFSGTFHRRHTFKQTFTLVAYGLSPLFALRVVDAFPISPWIAWVIGFLISAEVLYHGVPKIMQPDPPQAFGLYLISAILLVITTGLARFVTAWYLQGKFESPASVLHDWGSRVFIS